MTQNKCSQDGRDVKALVKEPAITGSKETESLLFEWWYLENGAYCIKDILFTEEEADEFFGRNARYKGYGKTGRYFDLNMNQFYNN